MMITDKKGFLIVGYGTAELMRKILRQRKRYTDT